MKLRTIGLISTLVLGLLAAPSPTEAQQAGKVYRIGYLSSRWAEQQKGLLAAFEQGLEELGYVTGKNIIIEQRYAERKLVASLARPGGTITGLSDYHGDMFPKRLELLKEVVPSVSRVAILINPRSSKSLPQH